MPPMTLQTQSLETVSHLCQTFQRSYAVVRRALEEIGARPALTINGVDHYCEQDVERLAEQFRRSAGGKR